jgi:hypothetical protein
MTQGLNLLYVFVKQIVSDNSRVNLRAYVSVKQIDSDSSFPRV